MIWHIFRKDCRLLWPLAVTVALLQAVNAFLSVAQGPFGDSAELRTLAMVFPYVACLGLMALVAVAVHQDPLPGTTQDWLIRPIRRRDLLLAKLLFVVLIAHGPLFLADIAECAGSGFGGNTCLKSALTDGLSKFLLLSLPAMGLATVTRSLAELIGGALAIVLLSGGLLLAASLMMNQPPALSTTGLVWIREQLIAMLFLCVAVGVLPLQYFRRATRRSRGLLAATAVAFVLVWFAVPWKPSFNLQASVAEDPAISSAVEFTFEPKIGRLQRASGTLPVGGFDRMQVTRPLSNQPITVVRGTDPVRTVPVFLPLQVSGVPEAALLMLDRVEFRLIDADGSTLYSGRSRFYSENGPRINASAVSRGPETPAPLRTHEALFLPSNVYEKLKDRSVRLEVEYWLSLLQPRPSVVLAALDGMAGNDRFGRCVSRADSDGDDIEVSCQTPTKLPSCGEVYLQNDSTGERNPPLATCLFDYAPYRLEFTPHRLTRFGVHLPFVDATRSDPFPVDGPKLSHSSVVIVPFEAQSHFIRRVAIPQIRLADWRPLDGVQGG